MNGPTPIMFDMFSAVACSRPKRRSRAGVGVASDIVALARLDREGPGYRGRDGNSRFTSAASGLRPYSQISKASACSTFAPASAP